jgi:hypothetical protein
MTKVAPYQLRKFVLLWLCIAEEADGSPETQPLARRVGWGLKGGYLGSVHIFCENLFLSFTGVEHLGTFKIQTEMGTLCLSIKKKKNSLLANGRFAKQFLFVTCIYRQDFPNSFTGTFNFVTNFVLPHHAIRPKFFHLVQSYPKRFFVLDLYT